MSIPGTIHCYVPHPYFISFHFHCCHLAPSPFSNYILTYPEFQHSIFVDIRLSSGVEQRSGNHSQRTVYLALGE